MKTELVEWGGQDAAALAERLRALTPGLGAVGPEVGEIVERVRAGGDTALHEISERLGEELSESLRVDTDAVEAAWTR